MKLEVEVDAPLAARLAALATLRAKTSLAKLREYEPEVKKALGEALADAMRAIAREAFVLGLDMLLTREAFKLGTFEPPEEL